jgi:hypothetical protein
VPGKSDTIDAEALALAALRRNTILSRAALPGPTQLRRYGMRSRWRWSRS